MDLPTPPSTARSAHAMRTRQSSIHRYIPTTPTQSTTPISISSSASVNNKVNNSISNVLLSKVDNTVNNTMNASPSDADLSDDFTSVPLREAAQSTTSPATNSGKSTYIDLTSPQLSQPQHD